MSYSLHDVNLTQCKARGVIMKVAIFGATGSVGRVAVKVALEQGHVVTVLVRDPAKLNVKSPELRVVKGNVMDLASVEAAIQGQDAVLCILGAGRRGNLRAPGTKNIIRAMKKTGVKRLICQSSLGVGDSRGTL